MPKFSVKKPFTILVMVVVMLILGVVSVTRMQMDLLPDISLPYIIVITTYPGASPERVESTVSIPLENTLGTVTGVENVVSFSYENYSMVQLEFADGTDLDSVLVKVYTALDTVRPTFPEEVGTPSVLELSTDMLANQYLAVSYEGMDIEELSRFVENNVRPAIERQNGVANVSVSGLIHSSVQVELDEEKVDALNARILAIAEDALEEAREQLEEAKEQLEEGQKTIDENRQDLEDGQKKILDSEREIRNGQSELDNARRELDEKKAELENQQSDTYKQLAQATLALDQLSAYQTQLVLQQAQLT
ncbi:MAG: efflux RND transporter permease subunit, partial [Lachnospiraceae bacterium]|nr:efflux RND transporter permease subunit [Lachnospiraceae bacterium]